MARKWELASEAYKISSVDRALDVLSVFTSSSPELSLSEIAERMKLPAPSVFRLLATLSNKGFIARNLVSGQYRLGHRLIALGEAAKSPINLLDKARPVLRRVRDELEETTYLSVRVGDLRVDVEQCESPKDIRRVITVGNARPLFSGCPSRVLLAGLPADELNAYLDRTKLFDERYGGMMLDRAQLEKEIAAIRKSGYAETRHREGAVAYSVPVRGPDLQTIAAFTVSSPYARQTPALRTKMLKAVVEAGQAISLSLGAPLTS